MKWLLTALSDAGLAATAYGVMNQTSFPSFGYMLDGSVNGLDNATTVWELLLSHLHDLLPICTSFVFVFSQVWESWFTSDNTYSHNHPMFSR
jgi:hypothetical protein